MPPCDNALRNELMKKGCTVLVLHDPRRLGLRGMFTEMGPFSGIMTGMSSPTLLFIVDRLRATGAARPCVALGFGPGLIAEAMLLR